MKKLSKVEVKTKIEQHFQQDKLDSSKTKKIKRLGMAKGVKLGALRNRFCKRCYADLAHSQTRITKTHKIITCADCGFQNKIKIQN